ncbi:hypothetical protein TNCV_2345381 [Trichonephila clavipes]|nr:hypothetical protein TNCV_2345381 [Trichonephila clavipes]
MSLKRLTTSRVTRLSLLSPIYSEALAKGNAEDTLFHLTGCRTRQTCRREKKKREHCMTRQRVENREGSLGYPGVVTPIFTKDSESLGKGKTSIGHLGIVTLVLT